MWKALDRRRLATKLVLGFGGVLALALLLGAQSLYNLRTMKQETDQIYRMELLGISHIKEANVNLAFIGRGLRSMMLAPDESARERARAQVTEARAALRRELDEARARIFRPENLRRLEEFERRLTRYEQNVDRAIELTTKSGTYGQGDAAAFVTSAEFSQVGQLADDMLEEVARSKEAGAEEAADRARAIYLRSRQLTLLLLAGGLLFGGLLGYVIGLSIRRPSTELRNAVTQLAAGRLDLAVPLTDYPNETGELARAVEVLQKAARQVEEQRWIKTHQASISGALQRAASPAELAQVLLTSLAPLVRLGHGLLYAADEDRRSLTPIGRFATGEPATGGSEVAFGEGLVGQCAVERAAIEFASLPEGYVRIASGLGGAAPRALEILPIQLNERLVGVIELASLEPWGAREHALLDGVLPVAAMSLEILERSARTNMLLDETQLQAAQLAAQAAELQQAKLAAEDATRAKSDFLANMSHEIRTPMNAIIGMSQLALQTDLDRQQRNYVEKVHRAAVGLLAIINDILDFSKIEAGKMTLERIDFQLDDVMDHLASLVGMRAEDKALELLFSAGPDVPTSLVGDPTRLGQVLVNLGTNAVKFTEKGEVVVGVEKVAEDDAGVELHFWVKDSGIGMTEEQRGRLFQSFSQADTSTTRKYGGTGLGLAISKSLVEKMNGRIWVESQPGKGSTFHFHARFGLAKAPPTKRMLRAEELRGVRALVVDDNASAREILSTMARSFGPEVDVARDGTEALVMAATAEAASRPYGLVLMDWKMPVMDGVETVRRLELQSGPAAPAVVLVTAYNREEALGSAAQAGVHFHAVLTKPVTPSTLLEAIGGALGREVPVVSRSRAKAEVDAEAFARLAGSRVLLVEDNDLNQELAVDLLQRAKMEVVIANNGQEALDVLAGDARFDGVLMDCQMPVMDGYTATREIRRNSSFAAIPIVAMTANAMAGDREKALEAGMLDHIPKPLDVSTMFAIMAKWFRPVGGGRAGVVVAAQAPPSSPPADATTGLGPLPGIDVEAGLATTLQNEQLYRRLLRKFRDGQRGFVEQFRAALQEADQTAPERLAHTLKGVAGNLGARRVQAVAGDLERACHEHVDRDRLEPLLAKVGAELEPVIEGLARLEPLGGDGDGAEKTPAVAHDPERVRALRARLESLLAASDTEAADAAEELARAVDGTPLAAAMRGVIRAVAEYDFDAAQAALRRLSP